MRLYLLLARVGKVRKGITPWFKAPVPDAPKRYVGWVWDPAIREWVETAVRPLEVEVEIPKYPRPAQEPRPAQTFYEPGWYWNGRAGRWEEMPLTPQEISEIGERGPMPEYPPGFEAPSEVEGWSYDTTRNEWVATIVMGERIGFTPPRSLPPGVNLASVFPADPYFMLAVETARKLVETGRWDILQQGDAFWRLTAEIHRIQPAAKYPHLIAEGIFDSRAVMHAKRVWLASQEAWQIRINQMAPTVGQRFAGVAVIPALFLFVAGVGYLLGMIAERLVFPDEESIRQIEPVGTYLLGPGNWLYSRNIGMTAKGRPFYSMCAGIGTEFVRHKRFNGKGGIDIIDFPGGFLETGYVFPRFVKYVWEYWELKYVGMLERQGSAFFMLKAGDSDLDAGLFAGTFLPEKFWCGDFHWYL